MLNTVFSGIFDTSTTSVISLTNFLLCVAVALVLGALIAWTHSKKSKSSDSFVITLAMLPAIVCMVILMVNGNVGAGVAVAGAFSLVRFRSVPGTAKEIGAIFLAMACGLMTGMGYLAYAALFTVIMCVVTFLLNDLGIGGKKKPTLDRTLKITIPEDLNYTSAFNEIFDEFTTSCEPVSVKTSNMGSLYKLTYHITLKDLMEEKNFMDALRCRNGNLEVSISQKEVNINEL